MRTRNLIIDTMYSLTASELKRFAQFLHSPYFRNPHFNNSKVYELFQVLKSYVQRLPERNKSGHCTPFFNWETLAKKLLPGAEGPKVKNRRMVKICSELMSYLLEFFAAERFYRKKVDVRIFISEELLERDLSQLFERHWKVKYFSGIYSEHEVSNIYHRYTLIRLANVYKEKHKEPAPNYDIELMLINKHRNKALSDLKQRARKVGFKLQVD